MFRRFNSMRWWAGACEIENGGGGSVSCRRRRWSGWKGARVACRRRWWSWRGRAAHHTAHQMSVRRSVSLRIKCATCVFNARRTPMSTWCLTAGRRRRARPSCRAVGPGRTGGVALPATPGPSVRSVSCPVRAAPAGPGRSRRRGRRGLRRHRQRVVRSARSRTRPDCSTLHGKERHKELGISVVVGWRG